jgi:hypothetical protein
MGQTGAGGLLLNPKKILVLTPLQDGGNVWVKIDDECVRCLDHETNQEIEDIS